MIFSLGKRQSQMSSKPCYFIWSTITWAFDQPWVIVLIRIVLIQITNHLLLIVLAVAQVWSWKTVIGQVVHWEKVDLELHFLLPTRDYRDFHLVSLSNYAQIPNHLVWWKWQGNYLNVKLLPWARLVVTLRFRVY